MDIKKILESRGMNVSDLEKVAAAIADISEVKTQQSEINKSLRRIESKLDYLIDLNYDFECDESYTSYVSRMSPELCEPVESCENEPQSEQGEANFTAHNLINENIGKS